jgi:choice-of-anchor B domain-containing protein
MPRPRLSATRIASLFLTLLICIVPIRSSAQQSRNVTLLAHMNNYNGYSSCWSYVHNDGREYAFELAQSGASVVRLTDPAHPVEVAFFNLVDSEWHEGRQYRNWFYITSEFRSGGRAATGLTIINMQDPDHPKVVASYHSDLNGAHTIDIDTVRGLLYAAGGTGLAGGGMFIYSLADPENPALLTVYGDDFLNYIHTVHVQGTRGYASVQNQNMVRILDLTDPAHPATLAEFRSPGGLTPGATVPRGHTHSAWPTSDDHFLYVSDETSGVGLYVYDIQDLSNIRQVYRFEGMPTRTIAHDPVLRGNLLFVSYYTAGARVYDVSNPAWPVEIGHYDTFLGRDGGFNGCWEVAPLFPSGIFVASDVQTGLYVFRLNASYGIVRGTVIQSPNNGPLIPGAIVTQSPNGPSTVSFSDGRYAIAVAPSGSVSLSASRFAYQSMTTTVAVTPSSDQNLDFGLRLSDAGTMSGFVRRATDSSPLNGSEVQVIGTPLKTLTTPNGGYAFPSVPVGSYQIRSLSPGQVPTTLAAAVIKGKTTALNFAMPNASSYDNAEVDRGWVLGDKFDDATRGLWARGVPNPTTYNRTGELIQTDRDRTPDPGVACFLTGNAAIPPTFSITDAVLGHATLTSPPLPLGGVQSPRIGFWRWYANYFFEFTPDDPFVTQLSNDGGQNWVSVDSLYDSEPGWQFTEIPVANYFTTPGDVLLRFVAIEAGEFGLVEAAIDDIAAYPGSGQVALAASMARTRSSSALVGRPFPSPTLGGASIEFSLPRATEVRAELFDVQGRLVRTLHDGILPDGLQVLRWDGRLDNGLRAPAGVYWLRVNAGDVRKSSRLVVLR